MSTSSSLSAVVRQVDGGALTIAVAALVVAVDQLTKHFASQSLVSSADGGPSLLGGWLSLTYTTNTGAAFGVLADRGVLFLLIGLVVLAVVVAYWRFLPGQHPLLRLSLGLQLGGAVGNVLDRVREGHVIDFIQIRYWPVFNVADSCIVLGVTLLLLHLLRGSPTTADSGAGGARRTHDPRSGPS